MLRVFIASRKLSRMVAYLQVSARSGQQRAQAGAGSRAAPASWSDSGLGARTERAPAAGVWISTRCRRDPPRDMGRSWEELHEVVERDAGLSIEDRRVGSTKEVVDTTWASEFQRSAWVSEKDLRSSVSRVLSVWWSLSLSRFLGCPGS